jgi:hypothetical protein
MAMMEFKCIWCGLTETYDEFVPPADGWQKINYARMGEYRCRCNVCGAFMYPSVLEPKTFEQLMKLFEMFAICTNAPFCLSKDIYKPYCENQHIRPDCLHVLFQQADELSSRLANLEKLFSSLNPQESTPSDQPTKPGGEEK